MVWNRIHASASSLSETQSIFFRSASGTSAYFRIWSSGARSPAVFKREDSFFFRKKNLERAHVFFEKYGVRAIILARFAPIVRTFVPFVAGVGQMNYRQFLAYNIIGGFLWIYSLTYAGYAFGNHPLVQKNFKLVILGIIFLSVLPMVVEGWRAWRENKKTA